MRTKFFLMMLAAIVMGSQVTLFAQEKKGAKSERRQFNKEQMLEIQCNQIIKGLALDDATTAKFIPVYKQYMEEMQATRHMGVCRNVANRTAADKQIPKPVPTDAEVEQAIKARFAQSRKILDVREKYYNEFSKILSQKQIMKIYQQEKSNMNKFRKEFDRRKGQKPGQGHHQGQRPRAPRQG